MTCISRKSHKNVSHKNVSYKSYFSYNELTGALDTRMTSAKPNCLWENCVNASLMHGYCREHADIRQCIRDKDCRSKAVTAGLCKKHGGGARCVAENCGKSACGGYKFCVTHGGGTRCSVEGCSTRAEGGYKTCIRHGAGKRCEVCSKHIRKSERRCAIHSFPDAPSVCLQRGCDAPPLHAKLFCAEHVLNGTVCADDKRRGMCSTEGCRCKAVYGYDVCAGHGGGKRCVVEGCVSKVVRGFDLCMEHGGGHRCLEDLCNQTVSGHGFFCKMHGKKRRAPDSPPELPRKKIYSFYVDGTVLQTLDHHAWCSYAQTAFGQYHNPRFT